ncbi:DUF4369 domain-containing protein [Puteibacter caeruleilacunae]|nr:DUF4369 domain-containing protein [Puteibacter caeruleilacunae]
MRQQVKFFCAILVLVVAFTACNQKKESGYTVTGTIKGVDKGFILHRKSMNDPNPTKYEIVDGKFSFSGGPVNEPTNLQLAIEDGDRRFGFYVENGDNTFEGELIEHAQYKGYKYVNMIKTTGSIVNEHEKQFRDESSKIREQFDFSKIPAEERNAAAEKMQAAYNDFMNQWIKEHSNTFYAGLLAQRLAHGQDAEGINKIIAMLDPKLNTSNVRALKEKARQMSETDVKPSEIIKANNVSYEVAKSFNGEAHKSIVYLGMLSDDHICALSKDGTVQIIDTKGKEVKSFKPELKSVPTTLAVDKSDNIYVMYPLERETTRKFRGKTVKSKEVYGFECVVLNRKGEKLNTLTLEGLQTATGARVADNKLMVSDWRGRKIGIFNAKTGAKESAINDMRPCCGILDFSINSKNEVLVANLGAFRVQSYDLTGKNLIAFGKRGKSINDFHGCCNPVSVAFLSNGAIVTVEKDPTRVKIYSNEGAKEIAGIEEMVKGCSYIPMIVDSKDNLYMASPSKGLVKCVSQS